MTIAAFLIVLFAAVAPHRAVAFELGANKFDLMLDYLGQPPPEDGNREGYRRVRRAMAEKAIADARDAGFTFLRVAVSGYFPTAFGEARNDLEQWQKDPAAFWAALDRMFDALDRAELRLVPSFVWNSVQFAALAGDDLQTFIREPDANSRHLLARFLRDFITRYRDRRTILFYEAGNELNLLADLDLKKKCRASPCVWDNFTTAEMIAFSRDLVHLIKSLDPGRPVTSGDSLPRAAAAHLQRQPEFAPGGADWSPDTPDQLRDYLLAVNQPFDIVSVHIYPNEKPRFGNPPGDADRLLQLAADAAHSAGKPLFLGEFGDMAKTPALVRLVEEMLHDRAAYAAVWVWEFYQNSTYRTRDTPDSRYSLEPGYTDDIIVLLIDAERRAGHSPPPVAADAAARVVLTWPLPCTAIDRPVEVFAVASRGAKPVDRVEFLADGQSFGSASTPPYRARFDPRGRNAPTVDITARAIAAAGNAAFSSTLRLDAGAACRVEP